MGRKPDTLIASFFDRGQKLGDNSNRYEQNCRACGTLFPKGRNEVLTNHIFKTCAYIPDSIRQRLILDEFKIENFGLIASHQQNPDIQNNTLHPPQVIVTQDAHPGLDLLAEASRRLGNPNNSRIYHHINSHPLHVDHPTEVDELTSAYLNLPEDRAGSSISSFQSQHSESPPPVLHPYTVPTHHELTPPLDEHQDMSSAQELGAIATSAHDAMHLGSDISLNSSAFADDELLNGSSPVLHPTSQDGRSSMSVTSSPINPVRFLAPKSTQFVLERTPEKSTKHKGRRPYTPDRRKDVFAMRQIGACLRCRILKKPCSGGNPCNACAAIGTPRIWNEKCIRTKLANQCNLFSVGLQSAISYRETTAVRASGMREPFNGYVTASHFDNITDLVLLKVLQVKVARPNVQAISSLERDCGILVLDSGEDELLLNQKVFKYLEAIYPMLCESEVNPRIVATIEAAHKMLALEEDELLQQILQLHSTVKILVDPSLAFELVAYSGNAPDTDNGQPGATGTAITPERWPQSYRVINAQLVAIADKHASAISKRIMTDLEKRLMHKKTHKKAHTFMGVLILLNCMERMSHLFACHHPPDSSWPLETVPHELNREGDQFAQVIDSLMQMRSITPSIQIDPREGILVPVDSDEDEIIREWFTKVAVTPTDMKLWKHETPLIREDCRSLDMKLIFHVIRPKLPEETPKKSRAFSTAPSTPV